MPMPIPMLPGEAESDLLALERQQLRAARPIAPGIAGNGGTGEEGQGSRPPRFIGDGVQGLGQGERRKRKMSVLRGFDRAMV